MPALNKINLSFAPKEFVVIVGSNGSGKSTLLNLIAGTYKPSAGEILFDEKNVNDLKEYKRSKWIARIFQNPLFESRHLSMKRLAIIIT